MHPLLQKLTIGIPVYNDVKYICSTIESCLNEAGRIVIYDNCSTDGTSDICAAFAEKYPHVHHIRHPENVGAFENFKRPLFDCKTEYFCWVGSHDMLGKNYALPLLEAAEKDASVALVSGIISHVGENNESLHVTRAAWIDRIRNATPLERVEALVSHLRDCFLVYAVFRTSAAQKAWLDIPCLGFDRAMLVRTAALGKVIYEPSSTFYARDFNVSRDAKKDQERRIFELARPQQQPVAKDLVIRNKTMAETALSLAQTPAELALAFRIIDKINRRFQNRRFYQRQRWIKAGVTILLLTALSVLLAYMKG